MQSLTLEYTADGLSMKSDLYLPDGAGKRPGVLVFPEAFGIGEHARGAWPKLATWRSPAICTAMRTATTGSRKSWG